MYRLNGQQPAVLIVEDDATVLHTIRDYLGRADFQIYVASSGWDALKQLKNRVFDLVISDVTVQDMDGSSLREKCIMDPNTRDMPFLFLAPKESTDSQVTALRAGVDDIVTKPFDPIVLVARVQAVLERRRSYEEMVRVDPLTRLLNRPAFESELHQELQRIERYGRHGSLLVVDVDDLSKVNQESGGTLGDLLLTCLAGVILTSVRHVDRPGRYRGEKLMIFMPETDAEGARIVAERIQSRLRHIADAIAGHPLTFTSALLAVPEDGTETHTLFQRADDVIEFQKHREKGVIAKWRPEMSHGVSP